MMSNEPIGYPKEEDYANSCTPGDGPLKLLIRGVRIGSREPVSTTITATALAGLGSFNGVRTFLSNGWPYVEWNFENVVLF